MKNLAHLTNEEMVRFIDGEIDVIAQARVETHLANCAECLKRYEELAEFSGALSHAVETIPVAVPPAARQRLEAAMEQRASVPALRPIPWWQWAAVAAGIVVIFLLLHHTPDTPGVVKSVVVARSASPAIPKSAVAKTRPASPAVVRHVPQQQHSSADNTFIRLPYSDPSLPVNTADIVRVEIPLSALANTGIIRPQPGAGDALVKADVLLGLDGQPSAIRLVSASMIPN